jgi:hypothetical protein
MRIPSLMIPLIALACGPATANPGSAAPAAPFPTKVFFTGRTEGNGRLKIMFKTAQAVRVHGSGMVRPDGTLILDQQVMQAGEAPRHRRWQLRALSGGRYIGTLSDATGPVSGDTSGNRLHLSYAMKNGTNVEQWLSLQPGGRVAINHMKISKYGITIARLEEVIRKTD